ncbi:MAG TPA: NAD(P)-dependent oxidoreductase, partial [Pyrinomonadaceae bacterium]
PTRDTELESRVVLNHVMRRALDGGPLSLYRNQHCIRDFVYVDDAVRAICAAAVTEPLTPGGKYIAGSGEGHSLREIVNDIARLVENLGYPPVEVLFDDAATLEPVEWREFVADYRRLHSATGWQPLTTLHQGIEATLNAFLDGGNGGQTR